MNYTDPESCMLQLKISTALFPTKPEPFRIAFAIMMHPIPSFCFETLLTLVAEKYRYAFLAELRDIGRRTLLSEWLEALADWDHLSGEARQSVYGYAPSNAMEESANKLAKLVSSRIEEMRQDGQKLGRRSPSPYIVLPNRTVAISWNGTEEQLRVLYTELLAQNCIGKDTEWERFRCHFVDSERSGEAIVWTAETSTLSFWYLLWLLNTGSAEADALISGELFVKAHIGRFSARFIQPGGKPFNNNSLLSMNRQQQPEVGTKNIRIRGVIKPIVDKVKAVVTR